MTTGFSLQRFRFHLEPKAPLRMPAYNKGNVIRGGFGSTFRRIVCDRNRHQAGGNSKTMEPLWFSMGIHPSCRKGRRSSAGIGSVFVIVFVGVGTTSRRTEGRADCFHGLGR